MKIIIPLFLFILLLTQTVSAELVVVVNEKNDINSLSKSEVIDLFMGRHTKFSNGIVVRTIDHDKKSAIKALFYQNLIGKSLARVNAYWARLRFTGRSNPPKTINNYTKAEQFVLNNISGIVYLERNKIKSPVKIVYSFQ